MKHLLPPGWKRPSGYSNGVIARGTPIYLAGIIGWDEKEVLADGFVPQLEQALRNIVAILAEGGGSPADIVRMTWYVTDLDLYRSNLREVGRSYRQIIGNHYPAMAVVGVAELLDEGALLEIETTAIVGSDAD